MGIEQAFEAHEQLYRMHVWANTWGMPEANVKYPVEFLLAHTEGGETLAIQYTVPEECGNPFFWGDFTDWLDYVSDHTKEGKLYWWKGYYIKHKNGNFRFTGKLTEAKVL